MKPNGCLGRLVLMLSLVGIGLMVAFGIYVRRVMSSPFIADLESRARAYPCIGDVLDPRRPEFHPEFALARQFGWALDQPSVPTLGWHMRTQLTFWAIDISTERDDANRLYAGLPTRRFKSFDDVARHYAGKNYCALDPARRQAVLDYYWRPREDRLEQAMRSAS
jgi:hypothetical protein